jgi:hypothetical protein
MSTEKDPDAKTDLQRRFLIGSSLAFAGTAASGVLTGCGGGNGSAAASGTGTGASSPAATPAFTPAAGTYASAQNVTISTATSGAQIYYTMDGSTPTVSSAVYSTAIPVSATKMVKAIATASGFQPSSIGSAAYTISLAPTPPAPVVATPTFAPAAGTYSSAQHVTISCTTAGAKIYYTTNGSTPTTSSTVYAGAITVSATETVKAIASASGDQQSNVGSAAYTIGAAPAPVVATPTFAPAAGTYSSAQSVTISCTTAGAKIYYTTNGATPTTSSTVYAGAIAVSATETVKAIATANGDQQSGVGSAAYTISGGTVATLTIAMTSPLPNAVEGSLYTETMKATGGVPPYTWALVSKASTNTWTLSSAGVVTGTPTIVETDTLSIKVTDSKGNVAGPQSFLIAVQSGSGLPGAPVNLQLINQGGPNNADGQGHYVWQNFTFNYSALATGYQGFSWLPATQGANPVAHYKIYRNGAAYDTVATPITITGYIVPSKDPVTALDVPNGLLHVTAVSGGTTSISDGKILCGLLLTSSAAGFVAGTRLNVATAYTGSGGTGTYYVTNPQTCGSAANPVTFQGWSYNDTQSTNCTYPGFNAPGVVYSYAVSAVDSQGNEGPKAYPSAYQFYGYSNTFFGNFDYDGTQTWNDTNGAPLNGPYDTYAEFSTNGGGLLMTFGGFAPYPPYGNGTTPGCLCPSSRLEVGAFNYLVFDIKPTDNTFQTSQLQYYGVTRAYGNSGGGDSGHWSTVDVRQYCTPPLAVGQWSHCKVPFSALTYGFSYGSGSFAATSQYNGTLTITNFTSLPCAGPDGSAYVSGPGIPPNTYINMSNYNSNTSPPSGSGPWVYEVMSPNIVGNETGSGAYTFQNTSIYKHGFQWSPPGSHSSNLGNWYMNNIGFSTV